MASSLRVGAECEVEIGRLWFDGRSVAKATLPVALISKGWVHGWVASTEAVASISGKTMKAMTKNAAARSKMEG